jgi:hypothetical protein
MSPRLLRFLSCLTLIAAVPTMSGVATATTPVDPPNEITLPPAYETNLTRLAHIVGTSSGFAWQANNFINDDDQYEVHYTSYAGASDVNAGSTAQGLFTLAGSQLRLFATPGTPTVPAAPGVDITTGNSIANPAHNGGTWGTGDGTLSRVNNNNAGTYVFVRTDNTGNVTATYPGLDFGGTSNFFDTTEVLVADPNGAVIQAWATRTIGGTETRYAALDYLEFSTGDITVLDDSNAAQNDEATMDGTDIVWTLGADHHHAVYLPRNNLTATPAAATTDTGIHELALSGSHFGYATFQRVTGGDEQNRITDYTGTLGGTFTKVTSPVGAGGEIIPADAGDFAVVAGTTVDDYGVYRLHPGHETLGENLGLFGPTAPLGLDASAGRILSVVDLTKTHPVEQTDVVATGNQLHAAASSTQLIDRTSGDSFPEPTGGNTAYLAWTGTGTQAVVLDGSTEVGRYSVRSGAYAVTMSGNWLLLPYAADIDTPKNGAIVLNLDTGAITSVPESRAIYGDTEYYVGNGGIHALDLGTGEDSLLAGTASCAGNPQWVVLEAEGNWVLCDPASGGPSTAYDVATGDIVTVPTTARVYGEEESDSARDVLLANGVVTWIDRTDRSVHVFNLATHADAAIGVAHTAVHNHQYLALNSEFVAWVAGDDTTRVVPFGSTSAAAPRFLSGIDADAFSPAAHGPAGKFRPEFNTDRPLRGWTFTVRDRHGHVLRVVKGTARNGDVRPVWNGRTTAGRREPDGRYKWSLTGRGAAGSLHRTNGSGKPITGAFEIDTVAPKAAAHAGEPRHGAIPVSWKCKGGPCQFTVSYQSRKVGAARWSTSTSWLRGTAATSVRFGKKHSPIALSHGLEYRFTVQAVDAAGNKSHATRTAAVRG